MTIKMANLFNTATFGGQSTGKYEATFILDKKEHAATIKEIQSLIETMSKTELKGKVPSDKICLKDGDETERAEFAGKYTLKASTKKRPLVINRDKTPIAEADNVIYAGCFVNGIISLWAQDNQFGKRINAQLDGVQFVRDGDPFSDNSVSVDAFDAFGTDEDF